MSEESMFPSLLKTLLTQGTNSTHLAEKNAKVQAAKTTVAPFLPFTLEIICRLCCKGYTNNCLPLKYSPGFPTSETIEEVLKNVIPEMSMDLIQDSCICAKCWNIVTEFYKLKLECLQNKQNFYEFHAKNGQQGDINVFVKQEQVHDYIETESEIAFTLNDSEFLTEDITSILSNEEKIIVDDSSEATMPLKNPNEEQEVTEADKQEVVEEGEMLSCSSCQAECINLNEALCHTTGSHGVHSVLLCKYCSTFFLDSDSLKGHLLKTHNKEFSCACGEKFISKQLLTKHVKHHPECVALKKQKDLKCPFCNLVFEEKKSFNKHKRSHTRNLYTCEICGKSHPNNTLLEEHRLIHSNIKRFMCEKCGQCFKQKSILWWHNHKRHINIKTKQCPHCPKKFFTTSHLQSHQIVHTKERKYECNVCSKRFTSSTSVKRHMVIHTGEKFRCNKCGLTYSQIHALKKHLCLVRNESNNAEGRNSEEGASPSISIVMVPYRKRSKQTPPNDTQCEICNKVYSKQYIMYHMRRHTGEKPEICKMCGKTFTTPSAIWRHMMTHTGRRPFKCEDCGRDFIQKVEYQAHRRRKHTGERPYECKDCNKNFVEYSQLHKHRKTRAHLLAVENVDK